MIINAKFEKSNALMETYEVDAGNNVSFTVVLRQSPTGFREFEIILSNTGSDDYSEVFDHPFYNNFVLPWSNYQIKEATKENAVDKQEKSNVIEFESFRHK